ncbi:MAG TPA: MoxR family ATPase [Verrucomicrobiota bacterium]|nr:MoxR family ATPase [Verrucomicrobiota bacterium]HNU51139.1 MoxR family ATPase [Verrucomicrobiota bacterium]
MHTDLRPLEETIASHQPRLEALRQEMAKNIVGQAILMERLLTGLLANGHVLLEGVPGLAKTATVNALAQCLHLDFARVQFTPDLLPGDLIGNLVFNPRDNVYQTRKGPVFANLVLADEINRAPAKVQSALLEAMQERQVTIGEETFPLPAPFLVLATMNPIEQEGTYALPEAQVDRFMLKTIVTYPSETEERQIMALMSRTAPRPPLTAILHPENILAMRELVDQIYVDDQVSDYIVRLVFATRNPGTLAPRMKPFIRFGGSPRASINLALAAKAHAFLQGRPHVTPMDIKTIAPDVLRHRVLTTFEADADGITAEHIVAHLLEQVPVP